MIKKTTLLVLLGLASYVAAQGTVRERAARRAAIEKAKSSSLKTKAAAPGDRAAAVIAQKKSTAGCVNSKYEFWLGTAATGNCPDEPWNGDLAIGITSAIGFLMMLVFGLFVYVKTNSSDYTMQYTNREGTEVMEALPIRWFWSNLSHPTMGWTAATYFTVFWSYLIVSVVEFVGWILWLVESEERGTGSWFFNFWASYVGLYGSWILYFLTVLFPIIQLAQLNGDIFLPGFTNAIVQITFNTLFWLASGLVHLFFVPYLNEEYDASSGAAKAVDCTCERHYADADLAPEVNGRNLLAKMAACSAKLQVAKCKTEVHTYIGKTCNIERAELTEAEYKDACKGQYEGSCDLPRETGETSWAYVVKCEVRRRVGGASKAALPDKSDVD